jgi:signal transduction histidine kinase
MAPDGVWKAVIRVHRGAYRWTSAARLRARLRERVQRIGSRLLGGFLLLILPTLLLGIFAVQRFHVLADATTDLSTHELPAIETTDHLRTLLFQQQNLEQVVWADQALQAPLQTQIDAQTQALTMFTGTGNAQASLAITRLVHTLASGVARGDALRARIAALVAGNQAPLARSLLEQQVMPSIAGDITLATRLKSLEEAQATQIAAQAQQETQTGTQIVLLVIVLAVPLSIVLALLVTRSLLRPLTALLQATAAVAAGDLRERPRLRAHDEIGQLADAFDTMRGNLRATIAALALERQHTQAIIDACADGLVLVDRRHRILQANPAATYLTGRDADLLQGHPWWELCGLAEAPAWIDSLLGDTAPAAKTCTGQCPHHADDPAPCPRCGFSAHASLVRERGSRQLLVQLPSGEQRWLSVSGALIPGDPGAMEPRLIVSLHDVSQLKAVDQLKSDFVAMVSHELRAPVTTVAGAVELLHTLDPHIQDGPQREVLDILTQQTTRLKMVVDEVLQVTRLEAGRLTVRLQPLPLAPFIHALVDRVRLEWRDPGAPVITVQGTDAPIWADPAMLEIVFRNILDNARKYGRSGSPIDIELRPLVGEDHVQVRITNQGPGIPPDQRERIFERFARGTATTSSWTRGYGLGLYIARELLRAHSGQIVAEDRADGACFVVTLCTVTTADLPAPVMAQ